MKAFSRRAALLGAGGAAGWGLSRWLGADLPVYGGTNRFSAPSGRNWLNDASGLSATPIHKHLTMQQDAGDALVTAIRRELAEAKTEGRPVNVGAARHSMGGQAIPRNGADLIGYFAPHEGSSTCAYGIYNIPSLAEYEAYRTRLAADPLGQQNYDFAQQEKFILREDRTWLKLASAPHGTSGDAT